MTREEAILVVIFGIFDVVIWTYVIVRVVEAVRWAFGG